MQSRLPLLLETIRIEDGKAFNLSYHQARCDQSRKILFHTEKSLDLSKVIQIPPTGLFRCRILYNTEIRSIEYLPYVAKEVRTLRIVPSNIEYSHKYADRTILNTLLVQHSDVDEIIIEKEGLLTDTSISNIALYDGHEWCTPKTPLLHGTMRAKLIDKGFLKPKDIARTSLHHYTQVALINAMIGFKILKHFDIQKGR